MFEKILAHFCGVATLAKTMGISQSAVSQWRTNGIPASRAIEIEKLTNGKFKASEIANAKTGTSNVK